MTSLFDQFVFVLRFFTRLPLPGESGHSGDLAEKAVWFPIAGLIIGLITGAFWLVASQFLPPFAASGLTLGLGMLITGGLHEDGFADCADGLGGGFTRERALEIMRDSRIGAYGTIALIFSIGLRWVALASLGPWSGFFAFIIAHSASRAAIAIPLAFSNYARPEGLGTSVAKGVSSSTLTLTIVLAGLIAIVAGLAAGLAASVLAFLAAWIFTKRLETRLGGYTGDGLGAVQQIAEITVLLALSSALLG